MKCKFCQAPIPSNSASCFHCGRQQHEAPDGPPRPVAQRPDPPKSHAKPIAAAGALAVASVVAFFALRASSPSPEPEPEPERDNAASAAPAPPPPPVVPPPVPPAPPEPPAWTGDEPLHCRGQDRVVLRDKAVTLDTMLRLQDGCALTLERCSLTISGDAIRLDGDSRLEMKGGAIHSDGTALRIDDTSEARFEEVAIHGTIEARGDSAVIATGGSITGAPAITTTSRAVVALRGVAVDGEQKGSVLVLAEDDDAGARIAERRALAANVSRYQGSACEGVIECYVDNGASGHVDIHVTSRIGDDGKAVAGRVLAAQSATPAARACLQKLAAGRYIDDFQGPKGTLSCRIVGTVLGRTQMISVSVGYTPDG